MTEQNDKKPSSKNSEREPIPYIVHEGMMARMERQLKRTFIFAVVIFVLFVLTNAGWIWYESQYMTIESTQTVTQETGGDGDNNYVGIGDSNGEAGSQDKGQDEG